MAKVLKITGVKCKTCGTIVYSRARNDWRPCDCGAVYVDGGFDYIRVGGNFDNLEYIDIELEGLTKQDLFDDWNYSKDKYGKISTTSGSSGE